jgi:hypothetical protein
MSRPLTRRERLLAVAVKMPPAAYVALTGRAPGWVRIWFVTWLSLWLLSLILADTARSSGTAQPNDTST